MENIHEKLKYPIGRFIAPPIITDKLINKWINQIAEFPLKLRAAVSSLNAEQLDTRYRSEGWTIRQVIHHLPDSHLNAYIRFKLALTEDNPTIRPYREDKWAECEEAKTGPIENSIDLLDSLHSRWTLFLRTLKIDDFERTYFHPEAHKTFVLKEVLGMYVWHGEHHLAHILNAKKKNNW